MDQKSRQELKGQSSQGRLDGRYYILEQTPDCLESIFCCFCEGANEYVVSQSEPNFNVRSKKGYINQTSDCLSRFICVCNRPFEAKLKLFNQEVATAVRPCKCCLQWMPCLQNEMVISNAGGRVLGILRVGCWCIGGNYFSCADAQIQIMYTIEGTSCQKSLWCPLLRCCYCPNIDYVIFDNLNLKVGKIANIYNGCWKECTSRADLFGIEFPAKAEEDHKILLTFAVMYLDYLRYETPICGR